MGARSGGGGGAGLGGGRGSAPTTAQVKAAHQQYQKAKASYDKAAKALNDFASGITPGGGSPKGDYQKISQKFLKASNKLDKAHDKWTKLKQAKKIADYKAAS